MAKQDWNLPKEKQEEDDFCGLQGKQFRNFFMQSKVFILNSEIETFST